MKAGTIQPDHMPANKYELIVVGMPTLTVTSITELTDATTEAVLPDGTVASGGKTQPIEFTIMIPRHHLVEIAAMDNWKKQGEDPIDKGYKKVGTLITYSGSGQELKSESLIGMWCRDRSTPALEMANDGEMTANSYVMRADRVIPV